MREMSKAVWFGAMAMMVVPTLSCSGGGGGGGAKEYGGDVGLGSVVAFGGARQYSAYAMFVGSAGTISMASPSLDTCVTPTPAPTPDNSISLSAGTSVTLQSGTSSIVLNEQGLGDYSAQPSAVLLGATYDFVIPGGTDIPAQTITGALTMPSADVTLPATTSIPSSGDALITWSPAGGDFVGILLQDMNSDDVARCYARDDGSFSIPASIAAGIPSGSGTLLVISFKVSSHEVAGRTMGFNGYSADFESFTK